MEVPVSANRFVVLGILGPAAMAVVSGQLSALSAFPTGQFLAHWWVFPAAVLFSTVALATWYGLVTGDANTAVGILDALWADMAVDGPRDQWVNAMVTGFSRLEAAGVALPTVSPSQVPGPEPGKQRIRQVLERHIDFEAIPDHCRRETPDLVVGTVDINAGVFETFTNEDVTVEAVLASAAVPNLFEAVEIHGHYHWDGLFSQNPPVNDLMHQPPGRKPEELWVVQVNPQSFEGEPATSEVIADRRNELSGNISLNQELRFIERVNDWVEGGTLPADEFATTEISRIQMGKRFHCSTKVDRSKRFLDELQALGETRAREFLAARGECGGYHRRNDVSGR